jgi:hypothetical protein
MVWLGQSEDLMPKSNPPSGGVNPGGTTPSSGQNSPVKPASDAGVAAASSSAATAGKQGVDAGLPSQRSWKSKLKMMGAAAAVLLLVMLFVIALLPTILSTGFVRRMIANRISDSIPGSVQINEWSLSWGKGQSLRGLVLRDPNNGDVLQIGSVEVPELSLWNLLTGSRDLGTLRVEDTVLYLIQDREGTNLDNAIGRSPPDSSQPRPVKRASEPFVLPDGVSGKIEWMNTRVVYSARAMTPLELAFDTSFDATDPRKLSFNITGSTRQGMSTGSFKSQGQLTDLFDALGRVQQDKAHVDFSFDAQGLPVSAVDRYFRVRRKLVEQLGSKLDVRLDSMLGPMMDLKLDVTGSLKDMSGQVVARSDAISLRCVASLANSTLSLAEPAGLSLRLTPERWNAITTPGIRGMGWPRGAAGDGRPRTGAESFGGSAALSQSGQASGQSGGQATQPAQAGVRSDAQQASGARPKSWAPPIGETFDVKLAVTRLSVPLDSNQLPDLARSSIAARLEMTPVTILNVPTGAQKKALPEVRLSDFVASIEALPLSKGLNFSLKSQTQQPDQPEPGSINVDGSVTDLITDRGSVDMRKVGADVTVALARFPMALADHLASKRGALAAIVGPSLETTFKARLTPGSSGPEGTFKLDASSVNLKASFSAQASKGNLTFGAGSSATLDINAANFDFMQRAMLRHNARAGTEALSIAKPATLKLSVDRLVVPLAPISAAETAPPVGMTSASLGVTMSNLTLAGVQNVDSLSIEQTNLRVESDRLDKQIDLTVNMSMLAPPATGSPAASAPATSPGSVSVKARAIGMLDAYAGISPDSLSVTATAAVNGLPVGLIDTVTRARGSLIAALGPTIDVNLTSLKVNPVNNTSDVLVKRFVVEARSANMTAVVDGNVEGTVLSLTDRSKLSFRLTPDAVRSSLKFAAPRSDEQDKPAAMRLVSPANVTLSVTEFVLPTGKNEVARVGKIDTSLLIDQIELADIVGAPGAAPVVKDLKFGIKSQNIEDAIVVTAGGNFLAGAEAGRFDLAADVKNPRGIGSRTMAIGLNASAIPVSLLDAMSQQNGSLVALLGQRIDRVKLDFSGTYPIDPQLRKAQPIVAEAIIDSPALKVKVAGQAQSGGMVSLRSDSTIEFTLSPEGFAALQTKLRRTALAATPAVDASNSGANTGTDRATPTRKAARPAAAPAELMLLAPAKFTLNITQAQLGTQARARIERAADTSDPTASPSTSSSSSANTIADDEAGVVLNPFQTKLAMDLIADRLVLARAGDNSPLSIDNIKASLASENLSKSIDVTLTANLDSPPGTPGSAPGSAPGTAAVPAGKGAIASKSQIVGLVKVDGSLDTEGAKVTTDTTLTNLPVAAMDRLALMEGQLVGVLGQSAAGTVAGKLSYAGASNFDVAVDSQNAKLSALFSISDGVLSLRQDLVASLKVTPELSKTVLKKMTGWVEAEGSDKPIELKILKQDFTVPLTAFDITKVRASGELDMGTLRLSANSPVIAALFTVKDVVFGLLQQGGEARLLGLITGLGDTLTGVSGGRAVTAPATNAQFTPMNFKIAKGVASYDKLNMTVEQLVVRFKGDVNLQSKANNLVMTIVGDSIAKSSRGEVLTFMRGRDIVIPVGGTYDKPKPDERVIVETLPKLLSGNGSKSDGEKGAGNSKNVLEKTADSVGQAIGSLPGVGELLGSSNKDANKDAAKDNAKDATNNSNAATPEQPANPKPRSGLGGLLDQVLPPSSDSASEQAPKPKKQPKNADKSGDKASEKSGKKTTTKPATDAAER